MTRSTRPLLALIAAAFAALALAACGGSSSDDSSTSSASSDEEKALKFQDCLRDRGIDIQISEDGGMMAKTRRASEVAGGRDDTQTAMEDCRKSTGWAPRPPSEEQRAEMQDRALEFAQCMRENGVDVPDPSGDGRMTMRIEGNRAAFERASEKCGGLGAPASAPTAPATP